MLINCGPQTDQRILNFNLPFYNNFKHENLYKKLTKLQKNYRIGILVSGGLDSALLYYLLLLENQNTESKFNITPYTILRKEGSRYYAIKVINYINSLFNIKPTELNIVGDNSLPEIQQVESGVSDVLKYNDYIYLGIIDSRPEHLVGWNKPNFVETIRRKYPLIGLQKCHIIDLIYKFNLSKLFEITHSCIQNEITPCKLCNGCMERNWGFTMLNCKI